MRYIKRPLAGWAREISTLRQEAKDTWGDTGALVYFRPLNYNNNHFTLLEINELEGEIRYYNSKANKSVIKDTAKLTRVSKLVQIKYSFKNKKGDVFNCYYKKSLAIYNIYTAKQ